MFDRRRVLPVLPFLAGAALFFIANRGAYKGYFQDDDLDNLSFTRAIPLSSFFLPLATLRVFDNNFRPVGHLVYRILGAAAGLDYAPYIAVIHGLHLINVVLLWLVLRRLEFSRVAAGAGSLFFAFPMAVFDVFWKPMYVFDLLCAMFCLLSLLAWLHDRWLVGLAAMFIAYRAKEVAIMLPVALAAYEALLGKRRWVRLIPYFALSAVIGMQALLQNYHRPENDYSLHLNWFSMWTCVRFYASQVFLAPYAGFLILVLLLFSRDRRFVFGAVSFCVLLAPMLLLPGRLFSAYLYAPLAGLAIAVAALAARQSYAVIAIFFALWLPWNFVNLRRQRKMVLAGARDRRAFVIELTNFNHYNPEVLTYLYDRGPLNGYGTLGTIKLAHPVGTQVHFAGLEDNPLPPLLRSDQLAILVWDPRMQHLIPVVRKPRTPDTTYLEMSPTTPIWQLEAGWYGSEGGYRWCKPYATARLTRPADARSFELSVNISPLYLEQVKHNHVTVTLNGATVGEHEFTSSGWDKVRWHLAPAPAGPVEVGIRVTPEFISGRSLGLAVGGFGFITR